MREEVFFKGPGKGGERGERKVRAIWCNMMRSKLCLKMIMFVNIFFVKISIQTCSYFLIAGKYKMLLPFLSSQPIMTYQLHLTGSTRVQISSGRQISKPWNSQSFHFACLHLTSKLLGVGGGRGTHSNHYHYD